MPYCSKHPAAMQRRFAAGLNKLIMENTAQLCRCNNCMAIMIDENPSDQPEFEIPENVQYMVECNDEDTPAEYGFFWGCPNCLTDGYFIDVTDISQLTE